MIDFACKKFDVSDIVKCSLNLTKSDFNVLKFLLKNNSEKLNTEELSKKLNLDKSTIQRTVKRLYEKNLISRSQINSSIGGYSYVYKIKNKSEINSIILKILDDWHETVKENIKKW
ncbi:MAG: helix-turn-helix domain-containing protein [Candidatus Pacearchaeota archaeon]|jgi:predicted transcriptional regulator